MIQSLPSERVVQPKYKEKPNEYNKRYIKVFCKEKKQSKDEWKAAMDEMAERKRRWEENRANKEDNSS